MRLHPQVIGSISALAFAGVIVGIIAISECRRAPESSDAQQVGTPHDHEWSLGEAREVVFEVQEPAVVNEVARRKR